MKSLKKLTILIAVVFILVLATTSCRTTTDCPAYGEVHKYQIEQRY
jgi:hypothetical protein